MAVPPISTRNIAANGLSFACDECGCGDDVALLLHGFPESRQSWRHQLAPLAERGWRVVAPDLRGYGASSRPEGRDSYRMPHLVADVAALFDALGARRRLLVGHDWGAAIAWAFALRDPRALDGLVVMNVPHPTVFRQALRHSWPQRRRSWYMFFFQLPWLPERLLTARNGLAVAKAFTGTSCNPDAFPPDVLARYRANAVQPGTMTAMLNYYRANIGAMSPGPALPVIRVPTLMIWGEQDTALGLELTQGYEDLVADFTLHRLPEASHWVQQDAPDRVNAILGQWLAARDLVPGATSTTAQAERGALRP
jgi:epoxide hydrolase 4